MIRYQYKKARLLFVGINPHPGSDARKVPFSNNKMFWYLLARAGLVPDSVHDLKRDDFLREMYEKRFNTMYGLGFVNLVDRPTRDITMLRAGEEVPGKKRLLRIVKHEKPAVVCFVGKVAYAKYSGFKQFDFGWIDDIYSSKAYVMHFPLHGKASVRIRELKKLARAAAV